MNQINQSVGAPTFEVTVLPHLPFLRGIARRLARGPIDPDDLVQDTLLRAWKYWDTFCPETNCRAWLARILTNVFKRAYQQNLSVVEVVPFEESLPVQTQSGWSRPTIDSYDLIDVLTPENQRLVRLVLIEGHSYAEAAARLNLPMGTVMSRLHRARKQLMREHGRRNGQ